MNGISALTEETPESSFTSSTMWGCNEKIVVHEPENRLSSHTDSVGTLILNFPVSRTLKNKFLLFVSHTVYGILL